MFPSLVLPGLGCCKCKKNKQIHQAYLYVLGMVFSKFEDTLRRTRMQAMEQWASFKRSNFSHDSEKNQNGYALYIKRMASVN